MVPKNSQIAFLGSFFFVFASRGAFGIATLLSPTRAMIDREGMKLPAIVTELSAIYHEDAFDENRMKY
jgi:hypothetical protein